MTDGDRESSPAWRATPKSARKVYDIIAAEIAAGNGECASITYDSFLYDHHTGAPAQSLRTLRYLRLIEVVPDKVGCYRLGTAWREIDTEQQAAKLAAAAREVPPRGDYAAYAWRKFADQVKPN